MLYAIDRMDFKDNQSLFSNFEKIQQGTLLVEGICTVIASYEKYAEVVAALAKTIRDKTYEFHDEMVLMSTKRGWGKGRFINDKIGKLFLETEDDVRELQRIVAEEENALIERITEEKEVAVADAMCLSGLRKMLEISRELVASLYCIVQVTSKYVDIFHKDGGVDND